MSILLTGASGMLGGTLAKMLGSEAIALTHAELDITDADAVRAAVSKSKPRLVINAAAYTDVDKAESEPEKAFAINDTGAGNVAAACSEHDVFCVHVSTDFVFDGSSDRPYREDDEPNPISVYSSSKLAGERNVMRFPKAAVVRTAWVYGAGHRTFLSQILDLARSGKQLTVVDDQTGSPTWVNDLAEALIEFSERPARGIYHVAGGGEATRFEFARAIIEAAGLDPMRVKPAHTADLPPRPAKRAPYAPLQSPAWIAAGYTPLRDWREALKEAITQF
ncbi:MAG: dTDP-4-dehydrorhamnose reductase [Actinomycetota bacterium]